jgi:hypothetical protein
MSSDRSVQAFGKKKKKRRKKKKGFVPPRNTNYLTRQNAIVSHTITNPETKLNQSLS